MNTTTELAVQVAQAVAVSGDRCHILRPVTIDWNRWRAMVEQVLRNGRPKGFRDIPRDNPWR